ncbi:MAG: alpha/beta fold hydrolase [Planctomycetota bacterium]
MTAANDLLFDGPETGSLLVLAHGAGAPMDSPFMQTMAEGLAARGLRVVRFEFPYMAERRASGRKRAPNPARVLEAHYAEVVRSLGDPGAIVIGGKSMGGRIASQIAADLGVCGVVCLGYPFHPPGRPTQLRTAHLEDLGTPTLILQGERDTFGGRHEVAGYGLAPAIEVTWVPDGDHSFKPRVRSGHTEAGNLELAIEAIGAWLDRSFGR